MPDADRPISGAPNDWNAAFSALPLETPPDGGWQRLTRTLDATTPAHTARTRPRWPLWLATAAAVSAVALVPVLMRPDAPAPTSTPTPVASTPSVSKATVAPVAVDATPAADTVRVATDAKPADADAVAAKRRKAPVTRPPVRALPLPSAATQTRVAAADPVREAAATTTPLQTLQSESAQLEALVALARDDRVASANGVALTGELDDRIGRIDASLSQPGLDDAARTGLWQQRVDTLRELAAVETTQRWMQTQGVRYDGALVSVD